MCGRREQLGGSALLDDDALVEEQHPIGDVTRERHLVRRHEDRRAALGERAHEVEHLADEFRVERRGDLVEQQHLGVGRDGADDRDALLLPAGEAVGVGVREVGEPDALEERQCARLGILSRHLVHDARGEGHVAEHRQMREEVVALEHRAEPRAHPVAVDARVGDVLVAEEDATVVDRLEQAEAAEERGFARSGCPDERDDLVRGERHRHPAQHLALAERLPDILRREHRGADRRRDTARLHRGHRIAPLCSRSRSRAVYQSAIRIVGIASSTKRMPATTYGVKL